MWKMPWYDIIYLYKSYAEYVDEEKKQSAEQQARIEAEQEDIKYRAPDFSNSAVSKEISDMKNSVMSQMPKF